MEDSDIIELYWRREERAITETDAKYGAFCHALAMNLLGVREDAEECVNDTYHAAWKAMPPERPHRLRAWLGKVVRNISVSLWQHNHAKKRCSGADVLLSELGDCVPAARDVESEVENAELGRVISSWLRTLTADDRALFVRRYWYGTALATLAEERDMPANRLAQHMYRLRLSLRKALEREGIAL